MRSRTTILISMVALVVVALGAYALVRNPGVLAREPIPECTDPDGDGIPDGGNNYACYWPEIDGQPVSGDGVVPELWNDNPNCADMGFSYGFKVDQAPNGTFYFTDEYGELTGEAPEDPNNYVTISNAGTGATTMNWSSSLGIDAVFVKGGKEGGNLYVYDPEDTGDTGLGTPQVNSLGESISPAGISHIEFCYDYGLDISKDAHTSFTRTYDWDITKTPDADYVGFAGDIFTHTYTISVDQTGYTDSDWAVAGTITIANNTPFDARIEGVSDEISDYGSVAVDCHGVTTFPYTLVAGDSLVCSYSTALPDGSNRTNTVTVTTSEDVGGEATADVVFDETSDMTEVNATVNVSDDYGTPGDLTDDISFGPLSDGDSVTYSRDFECSTDQGDYVEGAYTDPTLINTSTIDETGGSDTANVNLTCYAPVVEKDVTPAWEELYDWDITKNVDNTTFEGHPGDPWAFNYDIDVDLTTYDQLNFSASGTISVTNPHPTESMVVGLGDTVNGFAAEITADADCAYEAGVLTVPAGSTATCGYTVDMGDDLDGGQETEYTNNATVTLGGGMFTGSAIFTFGDVEPTLAEGSEPAEVTATDDDATPGDTSDDHHSSTISGTTQDVITYTQSGECPPEGEAYTNGTYDLTLTNVAEIDQTDDSDTETVTVICREYARIIVEKVTNPSGATQSFEFVPSWQDSSFFLSDGQSEDSGALDPGTYSVSETVPTGWQLTSAVCSDGSDPGSIDLGVGETVTCTFSNEQSGHIIVEKFTVPSGADQRFTFNPSWGASFNLGDGESEDSGPLTPGTYSVSEIVPEGWELTSAVCSDESEPSDIDLGSGETVTCTFTNTGLPSYTFQKYINGEDADEFKDAVEVEEDDTLTFSYVLTNTGNIAITWTDLDDDVFGSLTDECSLPVEIGVGESASCDILREAGDFEQGKQNIGTAYVEGLDPQTDPAWYRTPAPTPVTLLYFRAQGTDSAIQVEWGTAAEINMAGYYVYRGASDRFDAAEPIAFRIAKGSDSTYEVLDQDVEADKTYWYWLASVENDGSQELEGPVKAGFISD